MRQAKAAVVAMRQVAKYIDNKIGKIEGELAIAELFNCADNLELEIEQEALQQKDKLEFMVEMTRLNHNIDMNDNGEFKSELTNAMFVGWMAKVNKENK